MQYPSQEAFNPVLYQLIKQTYFRRQLMFLKLQGVFYLNYQYPYLVRPNDQKLFKKYLQKIGSSLGIGCIMGIGLSATVSRVWPKIFSFRPQMRILIRSALILCPVQLMYMLVIAPQRQKINSAISKTHQDLIQLGKDGDLNKYFNSV